MALDFLLQKVKDAIFNDDGNMYQPGSDRGNLIGNIENIFRDHAASYPQQGTINNPLPASQDPLGDPADQEARRFGNIRPASEDPLGDPADQDAGYRR